jgi:hypothetical protein
MTSHVPAPPPYPAADVVPHRKGGRPPGRRNNATLLREAAAAKALDDLLGSVNRPADVSALTLLQTIYRDPRTPIEIRMKAAALAAPLETAKPATERPPPKHLEGLDVRLNEAFRRTRRTVPGDDAEPAAELLPGLTPEQQAELDAMLS